MIMIKAETLQPPSAVPSRTEQLGGPLLTQLAALSVRGKKKKGQEKTKIPFFEVQSLQKSIPCG